VRSEPRCRPRTGEQHSFVSPGSGSPIAPTSTPDQDCPVEGPQRVNGRREIRRDLVRKRRRERDRVAACPLVMSGPWPRSLARRSVGSTVDLATEPAPGIIAPEARRVTKKRTVPTEVLTSASCPGGGVDHVPDSPPRRSDHGRPWRCCRSQAKSPDRLRSGASGPTASTRHEPSNGFPCSASPATRRRRLGGLT
jgi:hypothetical protein